MKRKILPYILLLIFVFLASCSSSHSSKGTGTLGFSLDLKAQTSSAAQIDCTTSGIATIEAAVYDQNGVTLATGGPWACSQHSGTISGIPAGNYREIVINTRDASGNILYRAQETDLTITAGQNTNAGTLTLVPFIFWSVNTIDTGSMGLYSAIAHDSNSPNKIHIAYYDATNKDLKYTTNASGAWVTASVDTTGDVGQYSSIAVDSGNKVHISYYDVINADLKYATNVSGSWVTTTVDSSGDVGKYSDIAVDGSGNIHISYYDATNKHLKHAAKSGGIWTTETVDTSTADTGEYSSIAVDSAGHAHISYFDATDGQLRYANNVSGWATTPIDQSGNVGQYSAIAIDGNGKVHISYYAGGSLKYATNASNTWVSTVIDAQDYVWANNTTTGYQYGTYTSIAVDSNNNVHISYHEMTYGWGAYGGYNYLFNLKYATNSSGSWNTYRIDSLTTQPYSNGSKDAGWDSITVDSNNKVHISYYNIDAACLKYATSSGSSWSTNTIDVEGNVGQYTSLAVDSLNKTYISYYDAGLGNLKYVTNSSGAWTTTSVDTADNVGQYSSIAVDSSKHAHISYYDATRQSLRYATNSPGSWATYTVDSGNVGQYTSIAVDSSNKAHISYYDVTNGDLKYATNASGTWAVQTVGDGAGDYGYHTSIALDSSGNAYISYSDASGHLKFATNAPSGGTSWTISTVDTGTTTAVQYQYTSVKLDASANAYISYYDATNGDIKYATNAYGSWATTTLDSAGNVGKFTSLARDGAGHLHISYYDATNADLRYATNRSGAWLIYTLDSGGDVGQYTSIAVDGSNKLHISYYDATNQDLKVMTNTVGSGGVLSDQTAPAPPTGLAAATISTSQINLGWAAGSDNVAVAGYKIYRNGTLISTTTSTTFADSGLSAYTQYCYTISAYDASNNESLDSTQTCAKTYLLNGTALPIPYSSYYDMALDSSAKAHVSYQGANALVYTTDSPGSWVTTTMDSGSNTGYYNSIAVDPAGNSHISYTNWSSPTMYLMYAAETAPGSWAAPTAIDSNPTGYWFFSNIAADTGGHSHIVYTFYNSGSGGYVVKYATDALGSWSTNTITTITSSYAPTIAVDSSNNVHIAYTTGSYLVYAKRLAQDALTSWTTTTVDTATVTNYWFSNPSIAVDSNGNAHISYYDGQFINNAYHLKYATNASGSWTPIIIDVGGSGSSVAIDPSNSTVHITYSGQSGLMYATFPIGSAATPTIYSIANGSAAYTSPIAVDASHKLHILTPDNSTGLLKYLTSP